MKKTKKQQIAMEATTLAEYGCGDDPSASVPTRYAIRHLALLVARLASADDEQPRAARRRR